MDKKKIIVAITGASGTIYAKMLLQELGRMDSQVGSVTVVFSENGSKVGDYELGEGWLGNVVKEFSDEISFSLVQNDNMFSSIASGSSGYDAMVVVPCSMGTMGRVANGISDNVLTRACDVMIKEHRKLIIVPREMPISGIHIENMLKLSRCGVVIIPASPAFYSLPSTIEALCKSVVDKIISQLELKSDHFKWGE